MNRNIKLLCTLGPSSINKSIVQALDTEKVDLFRINLSHTSTQELPKIVKMLKCWTHVPICIDIEGAQIRTGKFSNKSIKLKKNTFVEIVNYPNLGNEKKIPIYPIDVYSSFNVGDILQIDFNSSIIRIIAINKTEIIAQVIHGGEIGSNKAVSLDKYIDLPVLTEKDKSALQIAKKLNIKNVALSFASSGNDVKLVRKIFNYPISVISKIESIKGLNNLMDIADYSDAILIDRGDIGREISLSKIGLLQRYILQTLKEKEIPVFVATNLIDSMRDNLHPNRAEINDITSCIEMGVSGLVLAAETAIGKYPLETVRMVKGIINENKYFEKYKSAKKELDFFNDSSEFSLIEPHGGVLVQNIISSNAIKDIYKLPSIIVDLSTFTDIYQISVGTYSPLTGFMDTDELNNVLCKNKLISGEVWTLPILLQRKINDININRGDYLALRFSEDNNIYGIIKFNKIEKIDLDYIARKLFASNDNKHPGVKMFKQKGEYIISGEVYCVKSPPFFSGKDIYKPKQTRMIFSTLGLHTIIGFHTRNIIHRGHEYIQKEALKRVNGEALFISPVVGPKKEGDFKSDIILDSYDLMIRNGLYDPYRVFIGSFFTYSRYSGPREAVFTAICRKNIGCSHFIIGRDHTGVSNYYSNNASQDIFDSISDIGIEIIKFDPAYYCKKCGKVVDNCQHSQDNRIEISASKVRKMLGGCDKDLNYLLRPEISKLLRLKIQNDEEIYYK